MLFQLSPDQFVKSSFMSTKSYLRFAYMHNDFEYLRLEQSPTLNVFCTVTCQINVRNVGISIDFNVFSRLQEKLSCLSCSTDFHESDVI